MTEYTAPLRDMQFLLEDLIPFNDLTALPDYQEVTPELAASVLEEAGRLATEVISPLNKVGDKQGSRCKDGVVETPPGWRDAYKQLSEAGWIGLSTPVRHGGQGLPLVVSMLADEMWSSANLAFALCPLLTRGAIDALELAGSAEQQHTYLPRLVTGEWTGTMLLTEPQAGSDLAAVRSKATPQADGSYLLQGQKIFITYGEHDLAPNIIHLTLARIAGAPDGVKGLSLFIMPKFLVKEDGSLGERNDVRCASIEHKLGIHGSPTAVLMFGEKSGARGWLVGEANRGLEYMFIMMNAARFGVGQQGLGIAERAYQHALVYARGRVQGVDYGGNGRERVAIVRHPDVRRMLMLMKSRIEAMRALAAQVAVAMDLARKHPDATVRARQQAFVDLMIPVVKGWSTEGGNEIASLGVQIHGGMGFIEETGAAQYYRDARILTIYEGTTGIQALDLLGRKLLRDKGQALGQLLITMRAAAAEASASGDADVMAVGARLSAAVDALGRVREWILASAGTKAREIAVGAVPLLELLGITCGGWQLALIAMAALKRRANRPADGAWMSAKVASARFFADHCLVKAASLAETIVTGGAAALAIDDAELG